MYSISGRVINISSVAGCISMPFFAAYSISKHGVQTFSDVLRLEMQRFKVKVVTINPGNFAYATNVMNVSVTKHSKMCYKYWFIGDK